MRSTSVLLGLFLILFSSLSFAAIINVPADQPTIQLGINAAVHGDTVLVAAGTYPGSVNFAGKNIVVTSNNNAENTIIDGRVTFENFEARTAKLSGFTIVNNLAIYIVSSASPIITGNIFHNLVADNEIIFTNSNPLIERNLFYNNIVGNACIGVQGNSDTEIINNTFDGNSRGFYSLSSGVIAKNNIVSSSNEYGIYGSFAELDYNDVWNNGVNYDGGATSGANDISVDPRYLDPENADFTLQLVSPCLDAGDPNPQYNDPDGTRNDMGAYYYNAIFPRAHSINFGNEELNHVVNHTPAIFWTFFDTSNTIQERYEIEVGTDTIWSIAENWASGEVISSDTSVIYQGLPLIDGQAYFLRIRVHNSIEWGEWIKGIQFTMNSIPSIPELVNPNNNGIAFSNPPILTTLTYDGEGDEITYVSQISINPSFVFSLVDTTTGPSGVNTQILVDSTLTENSMYHWRSKAFDSYEESDYCKGQAFWVNGINELPTNFSLTGPGNGNFIFKLIPTFYWNLPSDPDPLDTIKYTLYLAIDSNFIFLFTETEIEDTTHVLDFALDWHTDYWWKVKAYDLYGGETWSSEVFRFYTTEYICGDADASMTVDISDAVYLISYIFSGGPPPDPFESGDVDCSTTIDISDAVYLIAYIFSGGLAPCEACP